MSEKNNPQRTPEELYETFQHDPKGSWTHVRVYNVRAGQRGGHLCDLDPTILPDVHDYLSRNQGAGSFDLQLARRGSNVWGGQARVEVAVDRTEAGQRGPVHQQGPSLYQPPAGPWGAPPPWWNGHHQQAPVVDVAGIERMVRLEAAVAALATRPAAPTTPPLMEGIMADLFKSTLLQRHETNRSFLDDTKAAFERGLEVGKKHRNSSGEDGPGGWLPVVDRLAQVVERRFAAMGTPVKASEEGQTVDVVAFVSRAIRTRLAPTDAIAMVRELLGVDAFRQLLAQRLAVVTSVIEDERTKPLWADDYAKQWVADAGELLDREAEKAAATMSTTPAAPAQAPAAAAPPAPLQPAEVTPGPRADEEAPAPRRDGPRLAL